MRKFSLFAVGLFFAVGCKKDPVDKALDGLESWKSKMCACKDKACADKVHDEYKKWENDVMEPSLKDVDKKSVDKGKIEKFEKLDDARKDCRRKFNEPEGGTPPAPPTP